MRAALAVIAAACWIGEASCGGASEERATDDTASRRGRVLSGQPTAETPLRRSRARSGSPASVAPPAGAGRYSEGEMYVQKDGTMLSAGKLSDMPQQPKQRLRPSDLELDGMHALFDDLDSNDDNVFGQQELGSALAELGLMGRAADGRAAGGSGNKQGGSSWTWKQALRQMDDNKDDLISEHEVVAHMTDIVMSKRQVANWLTYGVGLPQHADAFLKHSITGHDLPTLL